MINKIDKTDIYIFIGLLCTAFYVCCSSCLNPFALNGIDSDTSVYLTIARGITEGKVPFRDFFDNKGPLLYLISAPGIFLAGFTGVWITELILMCVSVFFAYKTALFFGTRFSAFLGVVFSFLVFKVFFYEVAGAEEYSMPFVVISLYIFTKYYFTQTESSIVELITLGICFAAAVLIRINMFPLWFAFCLVIVVESIIKRKYLSLFKYILLFAAGILIVLIPVLFYLGMNHALADFISQNMFAGGSRAFQGSSVKEIARSFFIITGKRYSFFPLVIGALWIIKNPKSERLFFYIGFILAFFLSVLFHAIIRTNYNHYNMIVLPFLVPAFTFFIKNICHYFSDTIKFSKTAVLLFLCVVFADEIFSGIYLTYVKLTDKSRNKIITTGKIIDQNTMDGDEIISLGLSRHIYLFTNRRPASKYIYQLSGAQYYPNTKSEFISDMLNKKPAIIVIAKKDYNHLPEWYSPVFSMIESEYRLLADSEDYYLYKKI